jgi:cell wall-associated NlpC family hydrolase
LRQLPVLLSIALLVGCASGPGPTKTVFAPGHPSTSQTKSSAAYFSIEDDVAAGEMVLYALGLLGTGYKFGGRNPEAGLDCSGMVSYIVEQVSGQRLPHNAARIADMTRPIRLGELQPGDLVFFNTLNRRHSHMGIYMGEGRFVHAPSSRGQIRVERLDNTYFKPRIDGARRLVASAS